MAGANPINEIDFPVQTTGYYLKNFHHLSINLSGFVRLREAIRDRDTWTSTPMSDLTDVDWRRMFFKLYSDMDREAYRPCQMGSQLRRLLSVHFKNMEEVISTPLYSLFHEVALLLLIHE